jgi:hypothetical protein
MEAIMTNLKQAIIPAAVCLLLGAAMPANAETWVTTTTTTYDSPVMFHQGIMSMGAARANALSAEPGRVERSALRYNDAGEPVYVFDIRNGDMSHIVRVSAITGEVIGRDTRDLRSGFFDRLFAPMHSDD